MTSGVRLVHVESPDKPGTALCGAFGGIEFATEALAPTCRQCRWFDKFCNQHADEVEITNPDGSVWNPKEEL